MSTADNKRLVERIFAELETGNAAPFIDAMADDFTWTMQGTTAWSGVYAGKAVVVEQLFGPLRAELEGRIKTIPRRIIADGDLVAVEAHGDNRTRAGAPYRNAYCMVLRVAGGALTELTEYLDTELVTAVLAPPRGRTAVPTRMAPLGARPLCRLEIELHPIQEVGATPHGVRRVFPVAGGRFEGERLTGRVLPHGGADWLLLRADGAFQQDVRMTLETDDGAVILMSYRGVRTAAPDVAARLARGEHVARDDYYLRTAPFFETSAERYAWLNRIVTIARGDRLPSGAVRYDVYEIL